MARINIEATANFAMLMALRRREPVRYGALSQAAMGLPMPKIRAPKSQVSALLNMPQAQAFREWIVTGDPSRLERARRAPLRAVSNAMFHSLWRNGSIEDFHAGRSVPIDLAERRFDAAEAAALTEEAVISASEMLAVCDAWGKDLDDADFANFALPLMITAPTDWSLTDACRPVRLFRA